MSKPTLNVPGVDPAKIECREDARCSRVYLDGSNIATLDSDGPLFDGCWDRGDVFRRDSIAVMNAAIDHWRATGRLFPEPKVEPVDCVCGSKVSDGPLAVVCNGCELGRCFLRANTVAEWNVIQAALKAAKK